MTDAELQGVAAQALNLAKRDMQQNKFNFLLASYHVGDVPPLHRMQKVEALIIEKLGEDWLNNGKTKDAGFRMLRFCIDVLPPDAVVFVTAANRFQPTAKFETLTEVQRQELLDAGHDRHNQAAKEGLLELHDCLCAIAQTPTRVCNYMQDFLCGHPVGNPDTSFFPQANFDGRIKMFGAVQ